MRSTSRWPAATRLEAQLWTETRLTVAQVGLFRELGLGVRDAVARIRVPACLNLHLTPEPALTAGRQADGESVDVV